MSSIDPPSVDSAGGIQPALLQDIHRAFVASPHFESHAALRALFNDARIASWRAHLPQVEQLDSRVRQIVDLLHSAYTAEGKNALHLLLLVLAENTPREQQLHYHLKALTRRLTQPGKWRSSDHTPAIDEPYLGLRTFQLEDADLFFGREALVAELLEKVGGSTFLAVLGPSGSGKSSAVLAGLLPALRGDEIPGSRQWRYLVFKPGPRPLNALAAALTHLPEATLPDAMTLGQRLAADEKALLFVADQFQTRLLLVVDQFEELWTQAGSEPEQRETFIRLLLAAAIAPRSPILLILTLRADFLHLAASHPALSGWIKEHFVLVSPMQVDDLRQAIEQPAALASGGFEPRLVERLIEEVAGKAGALPLLEYTLRELWQRRTSENTMTWAAFEALGGVEGALAARADEIIRKHYTDETREELRHLLLRLAQPGEGVEDTSRRIAIGDLVPEGSSVADVQLLLQPLVDERLLTSNQDLPTEAESIEVSHEALIRSWGTFRGWIEEARGDLRQQLQVEQAAREWQSNARDPAFLWSGLRLDMAEAWLVRARPRLSERDQHFLHACRAQKEALKVAARAQVEKEEQDHQERERLLTERATTARRNLRVVALLLILTLLLAGFAWNSQRLATQQAEIARREGAAGESLYELSQGNQEQALLLALAATHNNPHFRPLVSNALWTALDRTQIEHHLVGHQAGLTAVAFSPDSTQLLTASYDGTARLWDTASGDLLHTLDGHTDGVLAVTFSPDGTQALSASQDGTAYLWEVASGDLLQTLEGHTATISAVALSPDGTQALTASDDGTARLWDTSRGDLLHTLDGHGAWVSEVAFSPDGTQVLTGGDDGMARLWDATSGTLFLTLEGHLGPIQAVAFSPDGRQMLTASMDGTARLWDASNGTLLHTLKGHAESLSAVAFSPDGTRVLTSSTDGTARLWDVASGTLLRALEGYAETTHDVAFSPDGTQLLTGSVDGKARLWDAATGTLLHVLPGHTDWVSNVAFSPDGRLAVTASPDGTARLWDTSSGDLFHPLRGHEEGVLGVGFRPDGTQALTASLDGAVRRWDTSGGDLLRANEGEAESVYALTFSPDGTQMLIASEDGIVRLWDTATGALLHPLKGHRGPIYALAFSPDGTQALTAGEDSTARLWNVASGTLLHTLTGHAEPLTAVAFSPDGTQVLTADAEGTARLWDPGSGTPLHTLEGHTAALTALAFSPDGTQVLTADAEGTARLWDAASGTLLRPLEGHHQMVFQVAFSPDGTLAAIASEDGTASLWDVVSGTLLHTLKGHIHPVDVVAFSPDGRQLLTASRDSTARLWDVASGQFLHPFNGHTSMIYSVAFSPDGRQLLTGSQDGTARLWIISEALLVARLTEIVCHIRTDEEIKVEIEEWRSCDEELAAVADDLAAYHALRGE